MLTPLQHRQPGCVRAVPLDRSCSGHAVCALFILATLATVACSRSTPPHSDQSRDSTNRLNPELVAQLEKLETQERVLNESVWAPEILAQHQGQLIDDLWDNVIRSTNRLQTLSEFPVDQIHLGKWSTSTHLDHNIEVHQALHPGPILNHAAWRSWIRDREQEGWTLGEIEFRHSRFDMTPEGHPHQSTFYFAAQLVNTNQEMRALLEGDLRVAWAAKDHSSETSPVASIDASALTIKTRTGPRLFQMQVLDILSPPRHSESVDPLLVYDLDGDGHAEVIMAAANKIYHRARGSDDYLQQPLCLSPPSVILTAVIADFDRDGFADLLVATLDGLRLFPGSGNLTFHQPDRLVFPAPPGWHYPMVLTAGDIDGDGDLDLFLAQYRVPYERGSLPTPYHNANDGHPAFLLLNDGHAQFTDATASANLHAKRWRRTYSASLADLNGDSHLDLVVVSDFAGMDLYLNNGKGRFTDVTDTSLPDPHAFGMAHVISDIDADGRLDLFMIGMTSPTVDRLMHLNLWRPDIIEDRSMPTRMMYGNRLYLARTGAHFIHTSLSDQVARTGWSWGCAVLDFDNSTYPGLFIANGLESRVSVRDYESHYWLHDRFVGTSETDPAAYLYFQSKFGRTRGRGMSYGGYERNRFYLNQSAQNFWEIGHLLDLALQEDARHAVAEDLNLDGKMDLIVTGFEPWPAARQIVRLYTNTLQTSNHWIGFQLREAPHQPSPLGATISIHAPGFTAIRQVVTGDSYRSQHSTTIHFGLAQQPSIERALIRWADGRTDTLFKPGINQYHAIDRASVSDWKSTNGD